MSKVDDYIALGWITQDPSDADRVLLTFTSSIPKAGVNMGMVELYASSVVGWTPTIQVPIEGEFNAFETQPNPINLYEACRLYWANKIKEDTLDAWEALKLVEVSEGKQQLASMIA